LLKAIPSFFRKRSSEGGDDAERSEVLTLIQSFERTADGWFWATDAQGRLSYVSDNISRWLPGGAAKALGSDFPGLVQQADLPSGIRRALSIMMSRQVDFEKVSLSLLASEKENWWSVSGFAQFDEVGQFRGYTGFALDITEQQQAYERATRLAMYDPLTGLPNRLSMARMLEAALIDLDRANGSCAVLMLDLDRFKQVNDTLGHPAGDTLLKQVAERVLAIVGDENRVFRLGGDEFQIVLPKADDRSALGRLATKLIESLSQAYFICGSRCVIGASIGIAIAPYDGGTSEELIRNADLALYAAKDSGRGRYRLFSDELLKAAEEKRLLEDDLRDALAKGEIFLTYQPVVNAADNRLTGVEALMRWEHPKQGMISPSKFIAIAEENGLIEQLGTWALRQACADAASWPSDLKVAVNVSPIQFCNPIFPEIVMSALSVSGLPPQRLELEITEGVFLNESDETHTMFSRLKRIGVRLALDDFGTGYSSLGYLRTAPFDKIKIDQSFVRGATIKGSRNGAIMTAIVALAALGMDTTAEGIETMDQLALIRKLRVTHVQGFVYSKPLTSEELVKRFETGAWMFTPSGPPRQRSNRHTVYRAAAVVHGNQYCPILIRNLSESGALVEGMGSAPVGTRLLIDFGTGQLTLGVVRRVGPKQHGPT
jgi:diguanylate cyclase (GGDEF)-like protein